MTSNDILLYFFSNVTVRTIPVLARFMASRHEIGVAYWAGTMGGGGFQGWNHDQERATENSDLESVGAGGLAIESVPLDAATMCP
jgi:hypothetical protein